MAITSYWFGLAQAHSWGGVTAGETQYFIDYLSDTVNVMLTTNAVTPAQATWEFQSSATNEVAASGTYAAGGATLAAKTLTYNASTNALMFDANDVSWSGTITARYAIIYKVGGSASTSPLMGFVDFGADYACILGTFNIVWAPSGLFTMTPS
jgi:hypothetical protein